MLILILETSGEKGCVALAENQTLLCAKELGGGAGLSQSLACHVKDLVGTRVPDLVAVGIGPGSYTGIRVGASLAQALSFGWKVPLMGFCSLKAYGKKPLLVDARSGGFYALIENEAEKIGVDNGVLQSFSTLYSPHPELIRKRLGEGIVVEEVGVDLEGLAKLLLNQFLQEGAGSFTLNYCGSP